MPGRSFPFQEDLGKNHNPQTLRHSNGSLPRGVFAAGPGEVVGDKVAHAAGQVGFVIAVEHPLGLLWHAQQRFAVLAAIRVRRLEVERPA